MAVIKTLIWTTRSSSGVCKDFTLTPKSLDWHLLDMLLRRHKRAFFRLNTATTCAERRHQTSDMHIHASTDGSPSCLLITNAVIIITIIIIAIMITVILIVIHPPLPPIGAHSLHCVQHTSLPSSIQHWRENQYSFRPLHRPTFWWSEWESSMTAANTMANRWK